MNYATWFVVAERSIPLIKGLRGTPGNPGRPGPHGREVWLLLLKT